MDIDIRESKIDYNLKSFSNIYNLNDYDLKFYKPRDFKMVLKKINPDKFLEDMLKVGELGFISENYSDDCFHLCRNSVAWIIKQLLHEYYVYDIKIIEGYFDHKDHCWIQLGDYYIDMTLAQFANNCPKIAITLAGENEYYTPCEVYNNYKEWIKTL